MKMGIDRVQAGEVVGVELCLETGQGWVKGSRLLRSSR